MRWGNLGGELIESSTELIKVNFESWHEEFKRDQVIGVVNSRIALESLYKELKLIR